MFAYLSFTAGNLSFCTPLLPISPLTINIAFYRLFEIGFQKIYDSELLATIAPQIISRKQVQVDRYRNLSGGRETIIALNGTKHNYYAYMSIPESKKGESASFLNSRFALLALWIVGLFQNEGNLGHIRPSIFFLAH
ncbi:unnamed protein product, partial [Nesidiocoris tenuis]